MKILKLDDSAYLGHGNQRVCYIHPEDVTKVIKVITPVKKVENYKDQNLIDFMYFKMIEDRLKDYSHLARCYDWVETTKGKGLVFERVSNFDGSPVQNFEQAVLDRILPAEDEERLIRELNEYLAANDLLFIDAAVSNLLLQKINEESYRLIIVDGLGARKLTVKYVLANEITLHRKYKIIKQGFKLLKDYRKIKAKADALASADLNSG